MIPIDQTKLHSEIQTGNCFQAAIASIFELSIEDVPEFLGKKWWFDFLEWAASKGMDIVRWDDDVSLPGYYLTAGKSPRGDFDHVVVFKNGTMVHDPHPEKTGLANIKYIIAFLPLDPAKSINR